MDFDDVVEKHYSFDGLMEKIETGLHLAGKDINALTISDLAPIDAFHSRGRKATLELAELAQIQASDLILDVGCGLGGTARHLAEQYNCNVTGIDLTEEYVAVAKKLTNLVNMADQVQICHGSGLDIPYEDEKFDIVWTEHVQMNIADKKGFYSEIARVLKPGGRLLFHDVFRGPGESPLYPVPWAEDESMNVLVTEAEARSAINQVGLEIDQWIGKVQQTIEFFKKTFAHIQTAGLPPLGTHLLMGDNGLDKLHNYALNLSEDRVSVVIGMAHKR